MHGFHPPYVTPGSREQGRCLDASSGRCLSIAPDALAGLADFADCRRWTELAGLAPSLTQRRAKDSTPEEKAHRVQRPSAVTGLLAICPSAEKIPLGAKRFEAPALSNFSSVFRLFPLGVSRDHCDSWTSQPELVRQNRKEATLRRSHQLSNEGTGVTGIPTHHLSPITRRRKNSVPLVTSHIWLPLHALVRFRCQIQLCFP